MAAVQCGFDELFEEPLSEKLTCPICHLAFREPILTRCGHHFCNSCLDECLKRSASCPVCKMELKLSNTFPNNALKREILDLKIKCPLHEKGCEWTGELRNGEMHDNKCQYVDVACVNGCEQLVMRKDMDDHMTNQCPQRIVFCEHCNLSMKQVEMQAHYKVCDKYPIDCTYKCGAMVQRRQMEDHIGRQGTCRNSTLDCDFKYSGCQFRGNRRQLRQHIESNVVSHLGLLAAALKATKHELQSEKKELRATRDELAETKVQLAKEIRRRRLFLLPQVAEKFLFTLTVDNWHEKKSAPRHQISSRSFYVYPGYRLFIVAYPNYEPGYLGVFLRATEGDFDEEVKWPFPYSFDFEIVDQQIGGENVGRQISPPYGRALQSSRAATGYGYVANHRQLESRCYIKDDSIFIKLCIHIKNEGDED